MISRDSEYDSVNNNFDNTFSIYNCEDEVIKELGSGSYGTVYLIKRRNTLLTKKVISKSFYNSKGIDGKLEVNRDNSNSICIVTTCFMIT